MKAFLMGLGAMVVIGVVAYVVLESIDQSAQSVYSSNTVRQ